MAYEKAASQGGFGNPTILQSESCGSKQLLDLLKDMVIDLVLGAFEQLCEDLHPGFIGGSSSAMLREPLVKDGLGGPLPEVLTTIALDLFHRPMARHRHD